MNGGNVTFRRDFLTVTDFGVRATVDICSENDGKKSAMIHLCVVPHSAEVDHGRIAVSFDLATSCAQKLTIVGGTAC